MSLLTIQGSALLRFFQDTEIGALTNRFSQDMELIDMMLPLVASMFLTGNALPPFPSLPPYQHVGLAELRDHWVQEANTSHHRIRKLRGQIGHSLHRQQIPSSCCAGASGQPSDPSEILPSHFSAGTTAGSGSQGSALYAFHGSRAWSHHSPCFQNGTLVPGEDAHAP